jgi:hypothetical protein
MNFSAKRINFWDGKKEQRKKFGYNYSKIECIYLGIK